MKYKLLVVSTGQSPEVKELEVAARNDTAVELHVQDIAQPRADFGDYDAVYWRAGSVTKKFPKQTGRNTLMASLDDQTVFLNSFLRTHPALTCKSVQQEYVKQHVKAIEGIETFLVASHAAVIELVSDGSLTYPFIAKPNQGSRGEGVELIHSQADLEAIKDIGSYVLQNFIQNDGDYRVMVVGGVVVDVIKRRPTEKSTKTYLNNISQGGVAEAVEDKELRNKLVRYGEIIASVFELEVCGIDFVQDSQTKQIHFLEINSVPQWELFRPALQADVAGEIISLMKRLVDRKRGGTTGEAVRSYYDSHWECLSHNTQFHFLSRMHFFFPEEERYKSSLQAIRNIWLPDKGVLTERLTDIPQSTPQSTRNGGRLYRKPHYEHHHKVYAYNAVFFKLLFLKTIYEEDIGPMLAAIDQADLTATKDALFADPEAYFTLSTHAVNFTYHCDHMLWNETFDPTYIYNLREYGGELAEKDRIESLVYMFTHAIIGVSRFYSQPIKRDLETYQEMFGVLEEIVQQHFPLLSLDQKFEILTCAKLLNINSKIQPAIEAEAAVSLSKLGDYFVDTINVKAQKQPKFKTSFSKSEHRNVLGIFALN